MESSQSVHTERVRARVTELAADGHPEIYRGPQNSKVLPACKAVLARSFREEYNVMCGMVQIACVDPKRDIRPLDFPLARP